MPKTRLFRPTVSIKHRLVTDRHGHRAIASARASIASRGKSRVDYIPEVAARVNDPSTGRLLPQLLLGQRTTVTEQLRRQTVVRRL